MKLFFYLAIFDFKCFLRKLSIIYYKNKLKNNDNDKLDKQQTNINS